MIDRIVVKNGVVRFKTTGLIPEDYDLAELYRENRILRQELIRSREVRNLEMAEV